MGLPFSAGTLCSKGHQRDAHHFKGGSPKRHTLTLFATTMCLFRDSMLICRRVLGFEPSQLGNKEGHETSPFGPFLVYEHQDFKLFGRILLVVNIKYVDLCWSIHLLL